MGLGSYKEGSGISAALFFAKKGADVLVTDLRKKEELSAQIKKLEKFSNVKYVLGEHRENDFKNCDIVVKNPSIPKNSKFLKLARKSKANILNDWTLFMEEKDNEMVAVTGTRGKSTTTTLINEFLRTKYRTHLCGNIGVSPLAIISKVKKDDLIVAELSSWLLGNFEDAKKSPHIAVVTNLMPDHLNKYESLLDYYNDKRNIFKFQNENDVLILNKDNKETKKLANEAKSRVLFFSEKPLLKNENGTFLKGDDVFFQLDGKLEKVASLKRRRLFGEHNKGNILAAVCVACLKDIKRSPIQRIINEFGGVPNRLEFLREVKSVKFYNDTTATSPDAAIAALETLGVKKNIILLAGGSDKKLEYKEMAKNIKKYVKGLVLFSGDATEKLRSELENNGFKDILVETNNMRDAFSTARKNAKNGDIILLSPGAASFGLFENEFDRGRQFCELVKKI